MELQHPIADAEARRAHRGRGEVGEPAVRHHDRLGHSGRARGIDEVGELVRRGRRRGLRRLAAGLVRRRSIQEHDRPAAARQAARQAGLGQYRRDAGIGEQQVEAPSRRGGIERQVGGARTQHAEQGDDGLGAALEQESDDRLALDAQLAQPQRQARRPCRELPVGERLRLARDRDGVRNGGRASGDRPMHRRRRRPGRGGVVPFRDQLLPLGRSQQRELRDPGLGAGRRACQQPREAAQQAQGGGAIEQYGAVLERQLDALGPGGAGEAEVELRDPPLDVRRARLEPGQAPPPAGVALHDEQHLEQRRHREAALRLQLLDQLLEGHLLVRVSVEGDGAHLLDELAEARIVVQPGAQYEDVDEEPDQWLDLEPGASRHRRAHDHVRIPRITRQQRLEAGEKHHEQGRAMPPSHRAQGCRQLDRQHAVADVSLVAAVERTRAIEGKVGDGRRAAELLPPVVDLAGERAGRERLPLPGGEVGVLDGELRQRRRPAAGKRLLERGDLASDDADRPAVGDDVVHRDQRQAPVARLPHQPYP